MSHAVNVWFFFLWFNWLLRLGLDRLWLNWFRLNGLSLFWFLDRLRLRWDIVWLEYLRLRLILCDEDLIVDICVSCTEEISDQIAESINCSQWSRFFIARH